MKTQVSTISTVPTVLLALLLLCAPRIVHAGGCALDLPHFDDFDDNQRDTGRWGAPLLWGVGSLTETGQALEYTTAGDSTELDRAAWPWRVRPQPAEPLSVEMEVFLPELPLGPSQRVLFGLAIGKEGGADQIMLAAGSDTTQGPLQRGVVVLTMINGDAAPVLIRATSSNKVALRLSFSPTLQRILAECDLTGFADGAQWTRLAELPVNGRAWNLERGLFVGAYGESRNINITATSGVRGDNFRLDYTDPGLPFFDDFEAGPSPLWGNERGAWSAADGVYRATALQPGGPVSCTTLPWQLTDFTLELDVRKVADHGILLRNTYHPDYWYGRGVILTVGGAHSDHTGVYWHVITDATQQHPSYAGVVKGLFNQGDDVHVRLVVRGNRFEAYINGSATPNTFLESDAYPVGGVGLYHGATPGESFDNIRLECHPSPPLEINIDHAVEVWWRSVAGQLYQVQSASHLAPAQWSDLGSPVLGNGTTNSIFDSTRHSAKRLYRVILR